MLDPLPQDPSLDDKDPTEGVYHFVQATRCRQCVAAWVFDNPNPDTWKTTLGQCDNAYRHYDLAPTVPCCDICSPSLLDCMRPGKKPNTDHTIWVAFEKEENAALHGFIEEW
jgi:hypothetical protein